MPKLGGGSCDIGNRLHTPTAALSDTPAHLKKSSLPHLGL